MRARQSLPLLLPATLLLALACAATAQQPAAPPSPFSNLKVLSGVSSKSEMRQLMKRQAAALGVKCVHCHVPGKFELDEKPEKLKARDMMRMVREINATWFPDAETPAVTCWTCHRGTTEPPHEVPPEALAGPEGFQAADE
jgi:hypothetical protein